MREFTKSPLFLKIISLVCAVILWIYVIQVENPNINIVVSNIPIKYINQEIMEGNNLMLVSEMEETVTVTVQGRRKNITGLNADNMSATVDLKNVTTADRYTLPIQIIFPTEGASVVNYGDMYISFEADVKTEVVKPVNIEKVGTSPENYMIAEPVAAPDAVKITGPKSILDSIISAQADLDITDRRDNIDEDVPLKLIDKYGGTVKSQYVAMERDSVNVKCSVYQTKTVPVFVDAVTFDNGNEKIEKNYNVVPSKIRIAGTPEAVENINEINAGRIYMADFANSNSVLLELRLPEGVINVDNIGSVELVFNHDADISRDIVLNHFEIQNLGYNLKSELIDTELSVKVSGKKDALAELSAADFTAQLDLSDLEAGVHNVPVTINCKKEGVSITGTYTLKVKLTSSI